MQGKVSERLAAFRTELDALKAENAEIRKQAENAIKRVPRPFLFVYMHIANAFIPALRSTKFASTPLSTPL